MDSSIITSNQPSREGTPSLNSTSQSPNTRAEANKPTVTVVTTPATLETSHLSSNANPRDFATYLGTVTSAPIKASIPPSAEGKNEVKYSEEKIIICTNFIDSTDSFVGDVEIPKNGSFHAPTGSKLCNQVTEELFDFMVSETLKAEEHGDDTTKQQQVDQGRNTSMALRDSSSSQRTEKKSPTGKETAEFFKGKDYDLSLPGGSLLNQTLGHTCLLLYSQATLPKIHEQANLSDTPPPFECLDATEAIGFPCATSAPASTNFNASVKKMADLEYELEKIHDEKGNDAFLIKYTSHAQSFIFYVRDKKDHPELPSEEPAQQVMLDDSILQSSFTTLEIKITPNPNFNKQLPRSRENFPCTVECLDLRNSYRTEKNPQTQPPEQDFRSQATAVTTAATKAASQAASQAVGLFKTATSFFSSKKPPNE